MGDSIRPVHTLRQMVLMLVGALYTALPSIGMAAPGELAQVPLFLGQAVQPNIMMVLDDSGSMAWRHLGGKGLSICSGNVLAYNPDRLYTPWKGVDSDGNAYADMDPNAARLYPWDAHGPTRDLLPPGNFKTPNSGWSGAQYRRDADGDWQIRTSSGWRYLAQILEDSARSGASVPSSWSRYYVTGYDVYQPKLNRSGRPRFSSGRLRLKAPHYFPWVDANGNGRPDPGECSAHESIRTLPLHGTADHPNSQTNYANWYSYYRTRELVMKRAVSEVISASRERVGLSSINLNGLRSLAGDGSTTSTRRGVEITNVDDITLDSSNNPDPVAVANKRNLLKQLFRMFSRNSTPLRRALDNAGRYFSGSRQVGHGLFGSSNTRPRSPLLSVPDGGECQQNFTLLFSDGQRNGSFSGIGNVDATPFTPYNGASYADSYSDQLADIAMYYYQADFSGMDNRVAPTDLGRGRLDNNPGQHMVTYTISFGLTGSVDPDSEPLDATLPFSWPDGSISGNTPDDMYHAAWNGRGKYLSAADPQQLIDSLKAVFRDIQKRSGSAAAAVAVTSTSVQSGGKLFQAGFDSTNWTGTLGAFDIDNSGISSSASWQADEVLDSRDLSGNPRVLLTYNGSRGVRFAAPADPDSPTSDELSSDQIDDLLKNLPSGANHTERAGYLADIIAYFQGDRGNEGSDGRHFRERQGLLGDIVHSAPIYVGRPVSSLVDSTYIEWAVDPERVNRTPVVYVGSNDGMLHAFEANTGEELFAYLPGLLFSDQDRRGYHWLADDAYAHRYYVDLTIEAGDAFFNDAWHTVLVGGFRAGGKGVFALDITDPNELSSPSTGPSKVLWEFIRSDMGFSFAQPTITRVSAGDGTRAVVVVGNGYGNTEDGRAKIFLIDLSDGSLFLTLDTPSSTGWVVNHDCNDPGSSCNGMSSPAVVDLNGDGIADHIYAGDVKGNLWTYDISVPIPSGWNASRRLLFSAETASHDVAPITARPSVTLHPRIRDAATQPNILVSFSTGQLLAVDDEADNTIQSFYTVWDDGRSATYHRSDLVEQTISTTTKTVGGVTFDVRLLSNNPVDYEASDKGWYIDYVESGERGITEPLLFGSVVVWTTIVPQAASGSGNKCDSAGQSWLMAADLATGGEPTQIAFDVDSDGVFDGNDQVGGANVSGVHSGNIYWQPSIVSGEQGNGQVLLPVNSNTSTGASVEARSIQGISSRGMRSAWGRFGY